MSNNTPKILDAITDAVLAQEDLMREWPELAWAFNLGFESELYRDEGPQNKV